MSGPFVLVPIEITNAMLQSSSIAEPDTGETLWNPATNYAVGAEAIRTQTHKVYQSLVAGINATPPEQSLGVRWLEKRPTNRWALFDGYTTTQSVAVASMTYVLRPGLFNTVSGYTAEGQTLAITIKDAPGGNVILNRSIELIEPPIDYYDYYFGQIRSISKFVIDGILSYSDPEVTITITAGVAAPVKIGMLIFGDLRDLSGDELFGGVQFGARAQPTTTSLIVADGFGGTRIVRRTKSTDLSFTAAVPLEAADAALYAIQSVLDVPAAWFATKEAKYEGLAVFGLASGSVNYASPAHATIELDVKGLL
jgi:hypothetical protein